MLLIIASTRARSLAPPSFLQIPTIPGTPCPLSWICRPACGESVTTSAHPMGCDYEEGCSSLQLDSLPWIARQFRRGSGLTGEALAGIREDVAVHRKTDCLSTTPGRRRPRWWTC